LQPLSPKQSEIYEIITAYRDKNGFPPSQRDIARTTGMGRSTVRFHLNALSRKGYIILDNARHFIQLKTGVTANALSK
jgi:repressor LexA